MKAEQCDTVFTASANSVAPEVSVNLVLLFLSRYFAIFPGLPSPYLHITMKEKYNLVVAQTRSLPKNCCI